MTTLLTISFLAQRANRIEGAVILGIFVLTVLGSLGKWIVQQIAEKRERNAQRREGMPIDPPRTPATLQRDSEDNSNIPPFAAPVPPVIQRTRKTTMHPQPPVMERVMEVLLERATGTKLERRVREMMSQPYAPPPPPAARPSEQRVRKQPTQSKKPARPMTIAEREAKRDQKRQTEVELETQRLVQREQQFTDDTDQRLGHVGTHIAETDIRDAASADAYDLSVALDDPESLRRAFIFSEIIAPPLALREKSVTG